MDYIPTIKGLRTAKDRQEGWESNPTVSCLHIGAFICKLIYNELLVSD